MSDDIKIQTTAPDELPGGQKPLTDDNSDRRRGGDFHQNEMSFCRGQNVEPGTAGLCNPTPNNRPLETVSGMSVAAPLRVSVAPVDSRTIEGSYPGDHRAQAARAAMPNNPGPREGMGQTKISGRTPASAAPASFGTDADSDAGN